MSFATLDARVSAQVLTHLGESGMFTPTGGVAMSARIILDPETRVQGDLGQVLDPRPSATLAKAVVGEIRQGQVAVAGRTYILDRLISDDGVLVQFFVK